MTLLGFQTTVTGDLAVVALSGELDVAGADLLEHELTRISADHAPGGLVLDLSRLAFMDSTGLRLVVLADERARREGRRFACVRGQTDVQRVFEMTRMTDRLHFVDSAAEADSVSFELDLPRELESAAAARQAVDALSGRLPEDQLGDVRLLVSELVTNSLRHAEMSPSDRIRLGVAVSDDVVHVEVSDPGKGFTFERRAEDANTVEGWGLYLVATLADRWGVELGGNRVWFELDCSPDLDAAA